MPVTVAVLRGHGRNRPFQNTPHLLGNGLIVGRLRVSTSAIIARPWLPSQRGISRPSANASQKEPRPLRKRLREAPQRPPDPQARQAELRATIFVAQTIVCARVRRGGERVWSSFEAGRLPQTANFCSVTPHRPIANVKRCEKNYPHPTRYSWYHTCQGPVSNGTPTPSAGQAPGVSGPCWIPRARPPGSPLCGRCAAARPAPR